MSRMTAILLAGGAIALVGGLALAQTQDGTTGATSTGRVHVEVNKSRVVRISNLNDISFGATVDLPAPVSDGVCVFSTAGGYSIRAASARGTGGFALGGPTATDEIQYVVTWTDTSGSVQLQHDTLSTVFTTADSVRQDCGGGTNATVTVGLVQASYEAAAPGEYTDTLTLLISPN